MDVLIDTHFVFWYAKGDARMPARLLELIGDGGNAVFVSDVSVLEVEIKHAKNAKAMPYSGKDFIGLCQRAGFELLPLTRADILSYGTLDFSKAAGIHKDPFDRLLVAQAKEENMLFATHDESIMLYGEPLAALFR